jgi:uncharacterized protein YozE (UPF0346 family)
MKTFNKTLVGLALFSSFSFAQAATVNFNGDLTGQPTFRRTVEGTPPLGLSGVGTAAHYQIFNFTVDLDQTYIIQIDSANMPAVATGQFANDTFMILYSGIFNPTSALTNAIAANDDFPSSSGNYLSRISEYLYAATEYTLVVTAFDNQVVGTFEGSIRGTDMGTANFGTVPVPGSIALMGLGLLGMALRRKLSQ